MRRKYWWFTVIIILLIAIATLLYYFILRRPNVRDVLNENFGKPTIWVGNDVTMSTCKVSSNGAVTSVDSDFLVVSESLKTRQNVAAFFDETLVFWSEPERELVLLDKNRNRRALPAKQLPISQSVGIIIPVSNYLIVNTVGNSESNSSSNPRLATYKVDLESGDYSVIENAESVRGCSSSKMYAMKTYTGEFKIVDQNGKIIPVPNVSQDSFNGTWDFDPNQNLFAFAGGDGRNLYVSNADGNIIWQTKTETRISGIVFQTNGELWIALYSSAPVMQWSIAVYDHQGNYKGLRMKGIGLLVTRPLMPAEEWMNNLLGTSGRERGFYLRK